MFAGGSPLRTITTKECSSWQTPLYWGVGTGSWILQLVTLQNSSEGGYDDDLDQIVAGQIRADAGALRPVLLSADPGAPDLVHLGLHGHVPEVDRGLQDPALVAAGLLQCPLEDFQRAPRLLGNAVGVRRVGGDGVDQPAVRYRAAASRGGAWKAFDSQG